MIVFDAVFVLAFEFLPFMFPPRRLSRRSWRPVPIPLRIRFIVTKQFDRQIARRIAGDRSFFPDLVLQQPDAVFDVFP